MLLSQSPQPIDPGAPLAWWSQHEAQMLGRDGTPEPDDAEDDDDAEGDDEPDEDEDKSEDELRAELKAARESLSKASGSSKTKRDKIKALTRELDELKVKSAAPKPKADGDKGDEIDVEAIRAAAALEGKRAGEHDVKVAKVTAALADANVAKDARARLARMVDVDDFDLDDDEAIDEAIADLKKDLPELFGAAKRRRAVAGEADDGKASAASKPKDASARQAAQLLGKG